MKYLFLISITTLFLSCNSTCSCKMGESNLGAVKALYDAFAEGNVEAVVASMSPDIVWNEAENFIYADKNPYTGPDAVVEGVFGRLGAEWEYWNLEDKDFYPAGSNVLVTGRYKAKNKASAKELDAQFAHLWKVVDGKAVSFQQFTDTKQAAEAVMVDAAEANEEMQE